MTQSLLIADAPSEKALLNCLVYSGGRLFETMELNTELFFYPPNAQIFLACHALFEIGAEVNMVTLSHMLEQRGQLTSVGGHAAVSELGAYSTNPEHFHGLLHNAMRRRKMMQIAQNMENEISATEDVDTMLSYISGELASIDPSARGEHVLPKCVDKVKARLQRIRSGNVIRGVPTGVYWFDYYYGGMIDGGMYALGARPGMGKSAMMEQMMANMLCNNVPICCFAQDMAPDVLLERMACRLAGVSTWDLNNGKLQGWQIGQVEDHIDNLSKSPFRLHCIERLTGEQMISVARREFRKEKVKHFFLDHIQTIHVPAREERNESWAAASAAIRQFVNYNGVAWLSLAHLNREAAKERVKGHQIRGFDDLLGDVDGLVLLDSDVSASELDPGEDWPMDFIVDKNRNGPCGSKELVFERQTMTFMRALPTPTK